MSAAQAVSQLERRFESRAPGRRPVVLLLDELDLLVTKKQTVMYNFFNWPTLPHSKLIVVAIANTMDLPERFMIGRVASRIGLSRMTFDPYTEQELQTIVMARLEGTDAFADESIVFCSKKVASVSGDARRALDICRRAAELAEEEARRAGNEDVVARIEHVNAAVREMNASPAVLVIRHASLHERIFMMAVLMEFRRNGLEEAQFGRVVHQHMNVCRLHGAMRPTVSDLGAVCARLGEQHILIVDGFHNDLYQRIRLGIPHDDVQYALKSDPIQQLIDKRRVASAGERS